MTTFVVIYNDLLFSPGQQSRPYSLGVFVPLRPQNILMDCCVVSVRHLVPLAEQFAEQFTDVGRCSGRLVKGMQPKPTQSSFVTVNDVKSRAQ